ncbi:hypothetical protein L1049_014371 [Liquidambar formosana]|uniref:Uncharacterized protein n=1 Tax=Liquidambar formosana TaxID=63359 RepID=A0AAP0WZP9_LIQFO
MQDDDVPANEKQNTLQEVEVLILHPVDAVASDHSNHEAPVIQPVVQSNHESVIERVVQLQVQQSTDLPQESSEKQNPPQVEFTPSHLGDAVPTDQSNHEAPVIEPVMHSQLSLSADLPSDGCDQPVAVASGSEHQCSNERHTSSQNQLGLPSDSEFASSQSNHEALIIEPAVQLEVSQCPDLPSSDHSLPDLPSASGIDHQSNSEGHISSQNAQTPTPLADNLAEVPNQALSQPLTRVQLNPQIDTPVGGFESRLSDTRTMPIVSDFNNRPIQTASTVASRMPLHMHPDPLQNELERIRKEMDQTMKIHEDTKLSLKSECEKEIEEIVAQIHRKYEAKLHDVEAAFQLRKNELDTNRNKVFMNKLLAEAFRSKCVELKASAAPGMQQDVPSSFTQHLVQLSSQESAQRPLLVAGLSSVTLPAPSVQTAAPSRPPIVGVPPSVGPPAANPPIAVPPRAHPVGGQSSVGLPAGSLWTAVPPVPVFRHSPALLSSIPTRPPHISPITPSTGNLQVGSEIRAPAPHLQPFRPSTSLSAATLSSLPRGMPSQLAPTNAPATTLSLHQLPARPQPPPIYESGPYNRAPQPESAGGLPVLPTSSLSALELLMDIDNRPGAKLPNSSNFGLVDLAEFGTPGSTQVNSAPVDVASDVVYLSDDD